MTLRERLEAKARRHIEVRVVVDDTAVAARLASEAEQLAAVADLARDDDLVARAAAAKEEAAAALADCFVTVGFDALDPDDYEALISGFVDEAGELDDQGVLPALAAACAAEEDLRDVDWWAQRLTAGVWNSGERGALLYALTALNQGTPGPGPGKG